MRRRVLASSICRTLGWKHSGQEGVPPHRWASRNSTAAVSLEQASGRAATTGDLSDPTLRWRVFMQTSIAQVGLCVK